VQPFWNGLAVAAIVIMGIVAAALIWRFLTNPSGQDDRAQILSFQGGSIAFPTGWKGIKGSDPGRIVARSPDHQMQATISILDFSPTTSSEEYEERFTDLVEQRLEAERKGAKADVSISGPEFGRHPDGTLIATYEGHDASSRRFFSKMLMRKDMLFVLYFETIGHSQEELRTIATEIFGTIAFD
jgi:hypothetical protein